MTTTTATDPITAAFAKFADRAPREGDFYAEAPTKIFDPDEGDLVVLSNCWEFTGGRWEGFVSIHRGGTWAR